MSTLNASYAAVGKHFIRLAVVNHIGPVNRDYNHEQDWFSFPVTVESETITPLYATEQQAIDGRCELLDQLGWK